MTHSLLRLAPALALSLPLLAFAQRAPEPASAPKAPAQLRYQSTFADYKPYRDSEPGDWRALNDALGATAPNMGHAGHAGHGMAPMPANAAAPALAASAPAPQPHHGHHKHHQKGGTR